MAKQGPVSSLIIEELFSRGDDALLPLIQNATDLKPFLVLVRRWVSDSRPWARAILERYLREADRRDDRLLIKRLFKAAVHAADPQAVGVFVVPFDRYIRRRVVSRVTWDAQARTVFTRQVLRAPSTHSGLFSRPTQHFLRRWAWRYFRRMGFRSPDQYVRAVAGWLARYEDADVATGANLLDNWSLMHACFGKSEVLGFDSRHTHIREATGLSRLVAAPMFERLWQRPESVTVLMTLLAEARCRAVRVWSIQMTRRHHLARAAQIGAAQLLELLAHADDEVQAFGAELLAAMSGTDKWPVDQWLKLLETRNLTALALICDQFRKQVSPGRISLAQAVSLALSPASPVAGLGVELLRGRSPESAEDLAQVARLAGVSCEAHANAIAEWALGQLGIAGRYQVDRISAFFDSPTTGVRAAAIAWLTPRSVGYADSSLYARLLETPFDDVRRLLLQHLTQRAKLPGASGASLVVLWSSVLLNIHRGGRAKLTALRQISEALHDRPEDAETILPVTAVAIRSVRPAEARAGLSAVVTAVERRPELAPLVERLLPELAISAEGAAA